MTLHAQRSLQALVVAGLGLFLLNTIRSGTFFWYLNQRFLPLTFFTGIALVGMALIVTLSRKSDEAETHSHEHNQLSSHDPTRDQVQLPFWRLVTVSLPLILGVMIPARPLSASAVANKELNTTAALTVSGSAKPVVPDMASTDRTVLDWIKAFNYASDATAFEGQPADVVGFVYRDPRFSTATFLSGATLSQNQFVAARFVITHCVAEALATGAIVEWPNADLPNNTWVRVKGPIKVGTLNGKLIPVVVAESVEVVAEPERPYLYP